MKLTTLTGLTIFYSDFLPVSFIYQTDDNVKRDYDYYPNLKELADTYPAAKQYLTQKVKELKNEKFETEYDIMVEARESARNWQEEQFIIKYKTIVLKKRQEKHQAKIKKLEQLLYFIKHPKSQDTAVNIELARQIPITSLYQFNRAGFAKCPFHNETSASLHYNAKKNLWHCFGCQVGGDSIAFVMKLYEMKFLDAVKFLNNVV